MNADNETPEANEETDFNQGPLLIPAKRSLWQKIGGGSLAFSIIFHCILMAVGLVWIVRQLPPEKEKRVDFMPPGGGGGQVGVTSDPHAKKRVASKVMPVSRVAAMGVSGALALPEPDPSSTLTSLAASSGGSLAGGLGGSGSGGGRGSGHGTGFGSGNGPGTGGTGMGPAPFLMFGNEIKAESIGLILDVSGSMIPHLPKVINELDKVAPGSPLILYVGCGIQDGRPKGKAYPTVTMDSQRFERFWRLNHDSAYKPNKTLEEGSAKIEVDFTRPIPNEPLYKQLSSRPNTFYLDYEGTKFAWAALLCKEISKVEALYWFADFQDQVDEDEASSVMRKIRGKKQQLWVQRSGDRGANLETVQNLIVKPTGGGTIVVK